jgi:NADPH2:quinone reductase
MDLAKCKLEVAEVDLPVPGPGQVLVKMAAAPMNPSDYNFLRAQGSGVEYPAQWGNEGSGTVVATGGGFGANSLLGKNVAVMGSRIGTFGEYCVTGVMTTHVLPADIPVADGCGFTVNPWTAIAIAKQSKKHGGVLINTAAASALGKMLLTLCKKENLTLINIVRCEEQADLLKSLGASHVLVSPKEISKAELASPAQEAFKEELKEVIKATKCKCAFDCVAGYMSGLLMTALPYGGTVYVYGRMAPDPVSGLEAIDLIYRNKQLKGFFLGSFMKELGLFGIPKTGKEVANLMLTDFKTDFVDFSLQDGVTKMQELAGETRALTSAKARVLIA